MSEWKEFTATPEQIDEINNCAKYKLLRNDGVESVVLYPPFSCGNTEVDAMEIETTTHYMILEE